MLAEIAKTVAIPLDRRIALTVEEAGLLTGFGKTFLEREIDAGRLAVVFPSGHSRSRRVRRVDLDAWLDAAPSEPAA
ncbi:helix-turn-helix domain-containing protein [Nocardia abscessus]|uniref:helix-turn-helix domain-containing protein n=1 Tax=Nocardia abscessus TaxID=120957 RepID=UPI0024589ADB|nr:helix-turn-helix domain-containing protein [Nocardia abscessus]